MRQWTDMAIAPRDGSWIVVKGERYVEPAAAAVFWSTEGHPGAWFESEASSHPLDFEPTHWLAYETSR